MSLISKIISAIKENRFTEKSNSELSPTVKKECPYCYSFSEGEGWIPTSENGIVVNCGYCDGNGYIKDNAERKNV